MKYNEGKLFETGIVIGVAIGLIIGFIFTWL
jgi:hypothetical protein